MAISISPEELLSVVRLKDFSLTISASVSSEEEGESATVVSVNAEVVGFSDPGIVITPGETSVIISGKHITGFTDILTYVDSGQSDKTQIPKKAIGIQNMPAGQNMFDLNQDTKKSLEREFRIVVKLSDDSEEFVIMKQTVENDLDSITNFMGSYYK
jgi:hypothetical protein